MHNTNDISIDMAIEDREGTSENLQGVNIENSAVNSSEITLFNVSESLETGARCDSDDLVVNSVVDCEHDQALQSDINNSDNEDQVVDIKEIDAIPEEYGMEEEKAIENTATDEDDRCTVNIENDVNADTGKQNN